MRLLNSMLRTALFSPLGGMVLKLCTRLYRPDPEHWIEETAIDLTLPRLAPEFNGYRLAQISDFHLGTWLDRQRLAKAVERVNRQRPDLVAITGDFVTFAPEQFAPELAAELSRLQAPDGVVAVLGNHDHWTNASVLRRMFTQANILELRNRVYTLQRQRASLHLAGLDDVLNHRHRLQHVLTQLPGQGAALLLAHEPDYADQVAASGRFDLQLSGHTHGGQVRLPGIGAPILPQLGHKYPAGLYQVQNMHLYTNRGLGTAELPLRFNCPAEITLLTLHARQDPPAN